MKRLEDILDVTGLMLTDDILKLSIEGISIDSRKVESNFIFIAYKGEVSDGHDFIDQAIQKGAIVILYENDKKLNNKQNAVFIKIDNLRQKAGILASKFYDNPTSQMTVVGITGTNGKTTTASLLYKLYNALGYKAGLISTIENRYGDKVMPASLTTPDAVSLQELFNIMLGANVTHVFMEVSSHALHQGRVHGVDFDVAVFTNISHDHLDYHKTFADYIQAKKLLFDSLKKQAYSIVNIDDANGKVMVQNTHSTVYEYSLKRPAKFKAKIIANSITGLHLELNQQEVYLRLVGEFNAYNALAVYAVGTVLGEETTDVLVKLSDLTTASGRLDMVVVPGVGFRGVVDYAHTPDALQKVISTLKTMLQDGGRLITVVGCGGNRDKTKRPVMGKIAALNSDVCILTSDNPRDEDPLEIISEMTNGLDEVQKQNCLQITDRKQAIKTACLLAQQNDLILLAGKGHESYQEIKGQRFPFDDKKIIHAFMRREDI